APAGRSRGRASRPRAASGTPRPGRRAAAWQDARHRGLAASTSVARFNRSGPDRKLPSFPVAVWMRSMLQSKLPKVGTTIFTVMSQLAQEHAAVNLGQGFPDFDGAPRLVEGRVRATPRGPSH